MTTQALSHLPKIRRKTPAFLLLSFALLIVPLLVAASFVTYVLWPRWPSEPIALNAPALPITVAGTLFEVPPAAIRAGVQRHPGLHQRIDLAFLWPSLTPPQPGEKGDSKPLAAIEGDNPAAEIVKTPSEPSRHLFVTIVALGSLLPPADRLHHVYPRYVEARALRGANGLAVLPFRAGTPYDGEDLVYLAGNPDRFFTLCTRDSAVVPGICMHERVLGDADITMRFPRDWLKNWPSVSAGFDRLLAQLHPQGH